MGDFKLDHSKINDVNYANKHLFNLWDSKFDDLSMLQLVDFATWSWLVGDVLRSSILDHIYVNQIDLVKNVEHVTPLFGDHELIMAEVCITKPAPKITFRRDWRQYSKEKLVAKLAGVNWDSTAVDVQQV